MIHPLRLLTLLSTLPLAPWVAHAAAAASTRPNVVIFLADDESWLIRQTSEEGINAIAHAADSPVHAAVQARLKAQREAYQRQTGDPRITGDMAIFDQTRRFVLDRKFGEGGHGTQ